MSDDLWDKACKDVALATRAIYQASETLFPFDTQSTEERMIKARGLTELLFSDTYEEALGAFLLLARSNVELDDVTGGLDGELDLRILEGMLKTLARTHDLDPRTWQWIPDREIAADALFEFFRKSGVMHQFVPRAIEMLTEALELEKSRSYDPYVTRILELLIKNQGEQYEFNEHLPSPEDLGL